MTESKQKKYVQELTKRITMDIFMEINSGKIPEEWDGHELRCFVADKARYFASPSELRREPRRRRNRNYRQLCLLRNLMSTTSA